MRHSIGHCFLAPSSGDGATHADGLYLPPGVCDPGLSRYAHRMARSASPHLLLVGVHASGAPWATYLGRDGPVDPSVHPRLALWSLAQSRLLERASHRRLVGTRARDDLASADEWRPVSLWGWQPRRQTRRQKSYGAERAYQPASSLVFWSALRAVDGGVGGLSRASGLSAHSAQAPHGLSQ
jgi:hypothetical protein